MGQYKGSSAVINISSQTVGEAGLGENASTQMASWVDF